MLGRLTPGATVASGAGRGARACSRVSSRRTLSCVARTFASRRSRRRTCQSIQRPLLLLFGAVCMVLLIAATNVAALLLARGVQRRRETAVRAALGATRWEAMRPALIESFIITGVGVVTGIALATGGVRTIGALAAARMPQLAGLGLDARVLGVRSRAGGWSSRSCVAPRRRGASDRSTRRTRCAAAAAAGAGAITIARCARSSWSRSRCRWSCSSAPVSCSKDSPGLLRQRSGIRDIARPHDARDDVGRAVSESDRRPADFSSRRSPRSARVPGVAAASHQRDAVRRLGQQLQRAIRRAFRATIRRACRSSSNARSRRTSFASPSSG